MVTPPIPPPTSPDKPADGNGLFTLFKSGKLVLDFHPGQSAAWISLRRFILMLAGTQGGKTSFGPWWLWREINATAKAGDDNDYLVVTTNFDLYQLKLLPEMRRVFEDVLKIGRYWAGGRIIELRDPATGKFLARRISDRMYARIILRSANAPAGLESATAKAAWLDELGQDEWDVTTWEAIQRRLLIHQGRVLGTTTIYNMGWLKNQWYQRWANHEPEYDVIQFASAVNPRFPAQEMDRAARTMPEWRFKMFYLGQFAKPAGLIYHDFDESLMKVEPFYIPPQWRRVVGIDFGGANTAKVFLAEDPSRYPSTWYLYAEDLDGNRDTKSHAEKVLSLVSGCPSVQYAGGAPGETQYRLDWATFGVNVHPPLIPDVEVGISNVIALIKSGRFRVFSTCTGVLSEFGTYRRKLDANNDPTDLIEDKSTFHRLDALRYAASLFYDVTAEVYEY